MELQNSTALVTGATGNMGPYVTDALVDRGADVVGTYVTETARDGVETRAEYADAVSYHQVDLTDQTAVEAFAETVTDEHESVDHIVGLAGGFSMGGIDDTDGDAFEAALSRHATTAFLTVKPSQTTSTSAAVSFCSVPIARSMPRRGRSPTTSVRGRSGR